MFSLNGKIALVTGAASGIGAAIAKTFAAAGAAKVVIADQDAYGGQATAAAIGSTGRSAQFLPLNITDPAAVAAAVQRVGTPLDILVNNAGIGCVGSILQTSAEELDRLIAVNIRGTFLVTRAFLPAMLERRQGSVINLASIAGVVGLRDRFAYVTTKFAVVGMTKALALDHSPSGVRFNAICPARVETPWIEKRLSEYPDPGRREAAREEMNATQLAGRMVRPEEVAAAALYLAADESAMVTGSTLMVDSGWSAGK